MGVAAAAPATALTPIFERKIGKDLGNLLSAYALDAWAQVYPDLRLDQVVTAASRPIVRSIATYCVVSMAQALPAVLHAKLLKIVYLHTLPWNSAPWKAELDANTPGHMNIPVPLFIGQGAADPLIHLDLQTTFMSGLCKAGETVAYRPTPESSMWTRVKPRRPTRRPGSPTASRANRRPAPAANRPTWRQ